MTQYCISELYFKWLCEQVGSYYPNRACRYERLLKFLYDTEFTFLMPMDENRAIDGIDLRYRFGKSEHLNRSQIDDLANSKPCSVLEMMVALSIRCEECIMDDPDFDRRTNQWFWNMAINLGLESMTDDSFNGHYVSKVIDRFLNRRYTADGKGSLFYIKDCYYDLRQTEIWYQMMWYLDRYFD